MDAAPLVSVIMPAYNVEEYVGRALRSMAEQTLTNIEILAIDDGSTDRSGAILDEIARSDDRISVIHRKNGGTASARNEAMRLARGKYFYFMDADDWAEPEILQRMVSLAEQNALELTICGFFIHTGAPGAKNVVEEKSAPDRVHQSQDEFRQAAYAYFDVNLLYPPWNKLYLAEYIRAKNIEFPETFWDDFPFNLAVLRDVERVGMIRQPYYHFYRARGEAETSRYREGMYEKREEEHRWMLDLYRHWNISDEPSKEMLSRRYVERLVGCIENVASRDCRLSRAEKTAAVRRMIAGEFVAPALSLARPRSLMMRILLAPIRRGMARLAYLEGAIISRVKAMDMRVFAYLKASR